MINIVLTTVKHQVKSSSNSQQFGDHTFQSVTAHSGIFKLMKYSIFSQGIYFFRFHSSLCSCYFRNSKDTLQYTQKPFLFPGTCLGASPIYIHCKHQHTYTHTLFFSQFLSPSLFAPPCCYSHSIISS